MKDKFVLVTNRNYKEFYDMSQLLEVGPMLLPTVWTEKLWGVLVYCDENLIAGWVGTKRVGNKWISRIYQEVVFNSHPQIFEDELKYDSFSQKIIEETIRISRKWNISNLVLSPWARIDYQYNIPSFIPNKNASFIVDLRDNDDPISIFEHSQRKQVKKAIRNELVFELYDKETIDDEIISNFAELRETTQQRAIRNNKDSSMLLKSFYYYKEILLKYNSKLAVVYFQNKIAAMLLFIESGKYIYPYYAGSDIDLNRMAGASSYMYYKLMLYACQKGYSYFDMGGCPISPDKNHPAYGIFAFKKSFGGEYKEFSHGSISISRWKCNLIRIIKQNRFILRLLSEKI